MTCQLALLLFTAILPKYAMSSSPGTASRTLRNFLGKYDSFFGIIAVGERACKIGLHPRRNVVDSHATLIVTNTYPLSGGTLKTQFFCQEAMRSHFVVSLGESDAVGKTQRWLAQFFEKEHPVPFVLNVAGPRESKAGGIQKRTRKFLAEVLQGMIGGK